MASHPPNHPPNQPVVSVLMPTYGHAAFIRRAVGSLFAQSLSDWELVIVDDASPDDTPAALAPWLADPRVTYTRLPQNVGLGAVLNSAIQYARGRYIAYLPSDDLYFPDHLAQLVACLDASPKIYLAYSGLRYANEAYGPVAEDPPTPSDGIGRKLPPLDPSYPLAHHLHLVQVMHRRSHETVIRWPAREEYESDAIEGDILSDLAQLGEVSYTGVISCEWVNHADQRSKILAGPHGGLSRYRGYYGLTRGVWVNWQPTRGPRMDEHRRFARFVKERALPQPGGLKILMVGSLGLNPERVLALEERGHQLFALWMHNPPVWDTAGPLPYGNIVSLPSDRNWRESVRAAKPDVIYALLNWQALPLIDEIVTAHLGIPLVFHFKESPFACLERGLWPVLVRILEQSAAQIMINAETLAWFQLALGNLLDPAKVLIMDGDMPKADWFHEDWASKLSAEDGEIHTVVPGRPIGLTPFESFARAGIHVHIYGEQFHLMPPNQVREGLASGYLHLHPTVEPSDWVRELSRYDAAWLHLHTSHNGGDLRQAHWEDLNMPVRMGTYAAAGLPWLMRANPGCMVATERIAHELGIGIAFSNVDELGIKLRDRNELAQRSAQIRAVREQFTFDRHADDLIALFLRVIG